VAEPVPGNRIVLLETGDAYFPALEAAFAAAREEIHLETYIFSEDATGRRIAAALAQAARRGVAVRVLVDGFGARNLAAGLRAILEPAGVHVLVFRPERGLVLPLRRSRLRRMHRKLVVVDGRVGFCGGINIVDDRTDAPDGRPRLDFAVRVEGPVVAQMHDAARRLWHLVAWTRGGRRPGPRMQRCPAQPPQPGGVRAAFLLRDSFRHRREIEEAYLQAIRSASREIVIGNSYFLPGVRFRRALREAASRGVRVRLVLQGKREYFWVHYATRALYGSLVAAGIEIHEYIAAYLHAKVAVVDGYWATVGSSNIDPFSLLAAREANVAVEDEAFARALRDRLEQAVAGGALAVRPEVWAQQPWIERGLAWLAYFLARIALGLTGYARGEYL
jgi:cardiolipin synthase